MQLESFAMNLTSEQPERLFEFYRDVVGLTLRPEMGDHAFGTTTSSTTSKKQRERTG